MRRRDKKERFRLNDASGLLAPRAYRACDAGGKAHRRHGLVFRKIHLAEIRRAQGQTPRAFGQIAFRRGGSVRNGRRAIHSGAIGLPNGRGRNGRKVRRVAIPRGYINADGGLQGRLNNRRAQIALAVAAQSRRRLVQRMANRALRRLFPRQSRPRGLQHGLGRRARAKRHGIFHLLHVHIIYWLGLAVFWLRRLVPPRFILSRARAPHATVMTPPRGGTLLAARRAFAPTGTAERIYRRAQQKNTRRKIKGISIFIQAICQSRLEPP